MHSGSMPREALAAVGDLVGVAGGTIALAGPAWCAVGLLPQLRANVPTRS